MATNDSNQWESNPEYIDLMNFLIEKTKDVKSPLNYKQLAYEYKEMKCSSRRHSSLVGGIRFLAGKVGKMETIDSATKVKMIFALSMNLNFHLSNELRKNAYVETDEYRRIIKYRANDGSFNLEGEHPATVMTRTRRMNPESDDARIRDSTKRAAVEVPDNSTKRPKVDHREPGASHLSSGDSGSFGHLNQDPENYVPLENHPLSGSMEILNHPGVQLPQEPPKSQSNLSIQELREPKREREFLEAPGAREGPIIQNESAMRVSEPLGASGASDAYTSQIKFLETIRSLILTLDLTILSTLQAKIEEKLRESTDAKIPNDVMIPAMELMVAKITHHSVLILSENVESVSLSHLLCYLQALILNSKLEGLEVLMEKIKERIKNPALQDRRIPVEKVAKALQDTLNNVVF